MANSNIHWTTKVWNFIAGCSLESPGCEHCYAMRMAWRLQHIPMMKDKYKGTARKTAGGKIQWTGKINFDNEALLLPWRWRKPTTIFVNSMSDLFHPSVSDEIINRAFVVMRAANWHTFQVLTKRSERMADYLSPGRAEILDATALQMMNEGFTFPTTWIRLIQKGKLSPEYWPIKNIHVGVSVESEKYMFRVLHLSRAQAAIRFVSAEPLLGPLDFGPEFGLYEYEEGEYSLKVGSRWEGSPDWVIVGGESGPGARPMQKEWVQKIRDQVTAAGAAFFFKQWGEWHPWGEKMLDGNVNLISKGKRAGFYIDEGPMSRIGRARSGNLLDGRQWLQMPK